MPTFGRYLEVYLYECKKMTPELLVLFIIQHVMRLYEAGMVVDGEVIQISQP